MKEKILAAIKAKFPAVNLSKKRLDTIVAILEKKVTDESEIDAKLDEFNEYNPLAEIAKQDDAFRTMENKLKTPGQNPPKKEGEDPKEEKQDDDTPAWAKGLIESNKQLSQKIETLEGEKKATSIRAKLDTQLKDVPASYWGKRKMPEKDEDIEAFVTEVNADYSAFSKEMTDNGISLLPKPGGGGSGGGGNEKPASKEEVDAVLTEIM